LTTAPRHRTVLAGRFYCLTHTVPPWRRVATARDGSAPTTEGLGWADCRLDQCQYRPSARESSGPTAFTPCALRRGSPPFSRQFVGTACTARLPAAVQGGLWLIAFSPGRAYYRGRDGVSGLWHGVSCLPGVLAQELESAFRLRGSRHVAIIGVRGCAFRFPPDDVGSPDRGISGALYPPTDTLFQRFGATLPAASMVGPEWFRYAFSYDYSSRLLHGRFIRASRRNRCPPLCGQNYLRALASQGPNIFRSQSRC